MLVTDFDLEFESFEEEIEMEEPLIVLILSLYKELVVEFLESSFVDSGHSVELNFESEELLVNFEDLAGFVINVVEENSSAVFAVELMTVEK